MDRKYTPLYVAAQSGDVKQVHTLISQLKTNVYSWNIDSLNFKGWSALMISVYIGWHEITKLLISAGCSLENPQAHHTSALHVAAHNGETTAMHILILEYRKRGLCIDQVVHGKTALIRAVQQGHVEIVTQLLKAGASKYLTFQGTKTPLSIAVEHLHDKSNIYEDIINEILQDAYTFDIHDSQLLFTVMKIGNERIVEKMIARGCDVEVRNNHYKTPCLVAAESGWHRMLILLIQGGCDIYVKNRFDQTPMKRAVQYGHSTIVEELIKCNHSVDFYAEEEKFPRSPLHDAIMHGHENVVNTLIKNGCDIHQISAVDYSCCKYSPLQRAIMIQTENTRMFLDLKFRKIIFNLITAGCDVSCIETGDARVQKMMKYAIKRQLRTSYKNIKHEVLFQTITSDEYSDIFRLILAHVYRNIFVSVA